MKLQTFLVIGTSTLLIFAGCRTKNTQEVETPPPVEEAPSVQQPLDSSSPQTLEQDGVSAELNKEEPKQAEETTKPSQTPTSSETEPPQTESTAKEPVKSQPEAEKKPFIRSFTVTAKRYQFNISPADFKANLGDTVTLSLSSDDVPHGFYLPDFNVNVTLNPGETKNLSFPADKKGTFTVSCSLYCGVGHPEMKTTFVVN